MRTRDAWVLGLSLVVAAGILGEFHYRSRRPDTTIKVVGYATQPFNSDVIKWRLQLGRNVVGSDLRGAYAALRGDLALLVSVLHGAGVADSSITERPVNTQNQFDRDGRQTGTRLTQEVLVIARDIAPVEALALNPAALVEKNVVLENSWVEYHSSRIADLKRDLLGAATQDARRRAEQIVATTGARLGSMRSAHSGVFQINEPLSTTAADYGVFNAATRKKEITVTVHAEFALR